MLGISKYLPHQALSAYYKIDFAYNFITTDATNEATCPICGCQESKVFHYRLDKYSGIESHDKYCCLDCGHLFATWMNGHDIGSLYASIPQKEVLKENERKELQKEMMLLGLKYYNGEGAILDFGCGANFNASKELRNKGYHAYSCDIMPGLPYEGTFFKYDNDKPYKYKNLFSVISSVDVLEHLNDPVQDFKNFNSMLVPGGVMVHFSPMITHFPLFGSHADTAFHTCFFSDTSLRILCDKTGFKLIDKVYKHPGYWYYVFRKS